MLIKLNKENQLRLTDLIQENYSDLDLYREKPMLFSNSNMVLIVKPVSFYEHDIFLKDMAELIFDHYSIFKQLDFLTAFDYDGVDAMSKIIKKVDIFTADKNYSRFKKKSSKFIERWCYISKKKEILKPKHDKKKSRKFLRDVEPSEFIYILYLLFVYNFDIVKKNTLEFLKMFTGGVEIEREIRTMDTSSSGILRKAVIMPKFSQKPFNKSTLNLLEEQSSL